jgi:hypothetical protein
MVPTKDPGVFIEERRSGYVRYRAVLPNRDGIYRRWEVLGTCAWSDPTRHGPCEEGAAEPPSGPPESRLDVPVTPELDCALCVDGSHLRFVELEPWAPV